MTQPHVPPPDRILDNLTIVPIGGRIKAASVGMDLFADEDLDTLNQRIAAMRKDPPREILAALFPSSREEMQQKLRTFGLYRPTLKTDQGMAGNFTTFRIDRGVEHTIPQPNTIVSEEGLAIPEPHFFHNPENIAEVQKAFCTLSLRRTFELLNGVGHRRADKGRSPFFFIRLARADPERTFDMDIVTKVERETRRVLAHALEQAAAEERRETGDVKSPNLTYLQPDVYVSSNGEVQVEQIHCPDVGMFLSTLDMPQSRELPAVHTLMEEITQHIGISLTGPSRKARDGIFLITRDGVLSNDEDLLEQGDMRVLSKLLKGEPHVRDVHCRELRNIPYLPKDTVVLLMNIDYTAEGARRLFDRHVRGEIQCYPNPFVQRMLQRTSGLQEIFLEPEDKHRKPFLELAASLTDNPRALHEKIGRLRSIFERYGMRADILHAYVGSECIPILTRSSHSWRVFAERCKRYPQEPIFLRAIPLSPKESLLTSSTGKRMHVYRFTATVRDHD